MTNVRTPFPNTSEHGTVTPVKYLPEWTKSSRYRLYVELDSGEFPKGLFLKQEAVLARTIIENAFLAFSHISAVFSLYFIWFIITNGPPVGSGGETHTQTMISILVLSIIYLLIYVITLLATFTYSGVLTLRYVIPWYREALVDHNAGFIAGSDKVEDPFSWLSEPGRRYSQRSPGSDHSWALVNKIRVDKINVALLDPMSRIPMETLLLSLHEYIHTIPTYDHNKSIIDGIVKRIKDISDDVEKRNREEERREKSRKKMEKEISQDILKSTAIDVSDQNVHFEEIDDYEVIDNHYKKMVSEVESRIEMSIESVDDMYPREKDQ